MSDIDHGIAASIGAAVVGASVALKRIFGGGEKPGPNREEFAALERDVKELKTMNDVINTKIDRLGDSVEELCIARAKTDELLPVIRDQIRDLKQDLRDARRKE